MANAHLLHSLLPGWIKVYEAFWFELLEYAPIPPKSIPVAGFIFSCLKWGCLLHYPVCLQIPRPSRNGWIQLDLWWFLVAKIWDLLLPKSLAPPEKEVKGISQSLNLIKWEGKRNCNRHSKCFWKRLLFLDAYKMERRGEISATITACTIVQFCPAGCKLLKQGGMSSCSWKTA